MPGKGGSTQLNPVRLQTIPHLRVRRPNQGNEKNPCVVVMSSVLSMLLSFLFIDSRGMALVILILIYCLKVVGHLVDLVQRDVRLLKNN